MIEEKPKKSKGGSYWPFFVGAALLLYLMNKPSATVQSQFMGPVVYPDPGATVQGGGQGYSVQSLSTLSWYGPYATVG